MDKSKDFSRVRELLGTGQPLRWLFAGDSITHGALHTFGWRDYTEHFTERLRYEMARGRDHVIKTAISGWTVRQCLDDFDWSVAQHRPHVVSINYGMNDCTKGEKGLADFESNYRTVIERVHGELKAPIVLHVPNPILPNDVSRAAPLPAYSQVVRKLAAEQGCVLVDHAAGWEGRSLWYLLSDAIHPNDLGHKLMAHLMLKELEMWDERSPVCRMFVPPTWP